MLQASDTEDLTDPGASRHGNFMNYYQFHTAEERVRQLPHDVWRISHSVRKYVGLDVGCNAGNLTYALYNHLHKVMSQHQPTISLLGVDLDPILIKRARENNPLPNKMTFECYNFLSENCEEMLKKYLDQHYKVRFDVVFCFSVTMWIHLNHGDSGLEKFLRKACKITEMIIIEPQPWKCYKKASRRLRKAGLGDFSSLKNLKYKEDTVKHIEDILTSQCEFHKVTVTACNEWGRVLLIYKRKNN